MHWEVGYLGPISITHEKEKNESKDHSNVRTTGHNSTFNQQRHTSDKSETINVCRTINIEKLVIIDNIREYMCIPETFSDLKFRDLHVEKV